MTTSGTDHEAQLVARQEISPRRLLPKIIDMNATVHPTKLYAIFPKSDSTPDRLVNYDYKQLANAINHVAGYLDDNLPESRKFDTFAYIGSKDVRYSILAMAALKTRRKALFPSPFGSVNGLLHIFEVTKCSTVLISEPLALNTLVREAYLQRPDLKVIVVPDRDSWLFAEAAPPYIYDRSFEEAENDPFMIVHTSGTTGAPKPIVYTNGYVATYDAQRYMQEHDGPMWWHLVAGKKLFSPMPTLHVAGIFTSLILPVFFDATVVLGPGNKPLSLDMVNQVHDLGVLDGGLYPPSILEEISKSPEALEKIQRLDFIMYTGAPLSEQAGEHLSSSVKLHNIIGSTEMGVFPTIQCCKTDWFYFRFHPMFGHIMEPHGEGRYELVLRKRPELRPFQSVFHIFPDISEYRTRDLFMLHPEKPHYWRYQGRVDDLIILSHGEDLDPIAMEGVIRQNSKVSAAVIGGEGRPRPFLLCELIDDADAHQVDAKARMLDALRPSLAEANTMCSPYVNLVPQLVLFTTPNKPLARTLKGSVNRRQSVEDYHSEIDELYNAAL